MRILNKMVLLETNYEKMNIVNNKRLAIYHFHWSLSQLELFLLFVFNICIVDTGYSKS